MLKQLRIKNIALIDECTIEFGSGFNVLTGETGAGKSIIIDALNFVLGARADKTLIKSGTDSAYVVGVFDLSDVPNYEQILIDADIEPDSTLIITRKMTVAGKNECKINGELSALSVIKKITSKLVDIFGQHDSTALLDVKNHIVFLDSVSDAKIEQLKSTIADYLSQIRSIEAKISDLGGLGAERERNIDILNFQINEIEGADLQINEEEQLAQALDKQRNFEKIVDNLNAVSGVLDGEYSFTGAIKSACNNLTALEKYDNLYADLSTRLQSIKYEIEDINDVIARELQKVEFSESELNSLMERLDLIKDLKRKYGADIPAILEYLCDSKSKLDELINATQNIEELQKQKTILVNGLFVACTELTNCRRDNAIVLTENILTELKELGMKNAQFEVKFSNYNRSNFLQFVSVNGADEVEFMFSANLGVPCQPLSKIISGGEMSRFMLAFKCVVGSNIKTYVFDEIDTGIGGDVGTIVARKLSRIASNAQVLCVTHLAQIACFGDINFKIQKFEDTNTYTNVILLDNIGKIEEVTRMIGSVDSREFARKHAEELIREADNIKINI